MSETPRPSRPRPGRELSPGPFREWRPSVGSLDVPNDGKARSQAGDQARVHAFGRVEQLFVELDAASPVELRGLIVRNTSKKPADEDADPALRADEDLSTARTELLHASSIEGASCDPQPQNWVNAGSCECLPTFERQDQAGL